MHHPVFRHYAPWAGRVPAGFTVDFLGIRTRIDFFSTYARAEQRIDRDERAALPAVNEEYFEWIDLLEAIESATETFTMIELGAGYGRWLVRAATALRQRRPGVRPRLIGVEAEPEHFRMMRTHFRDNGLDPADATLIEAAVSAADGEVAFFTGHADAWYGQFVQPFEGYRVRDERFADAAATAVRAVSLSTLLAPLGRVDLIDLDIQGHEFEVLRGGVEAMCDKVVRVHVETHFDHVERDIRALMHAHGWTCERDYPIGETCDTPFGAVRFEGGVQTWVNPRVA